METPYTDHLTAQDFEHVYEPAEDTFLLLDALEDDLEYLQHIEPCLILEIGSGSGLLITALSKKFHQSLCLATDINAKACQATKRTAQRNGAQVDTVHCNLMDGLRAHSVDVLLFNPPYVVTSDEELQHKEPAFTESSKIMTQKNLIYSWAGGAAGRRVIDALLLQLNEILSPTGVFYLLLLRENKPDEVILRLRELNFEATKFKERRIPGEYLYIIKVIRSNILK